MARNWAVRVLNLLVALLLVGDLGMILASSKGSGVSSELKAEEKKLQILITGSAGRIGRTLIRGMKGRYHLRGLDIHPTPGLEDSVVGDVGDLETMLRVSEGMDVVIHLANVRTGKDSWHDLLSNMVGTYNVLEAAKRKGVPRVVYASRAGLLAPYPESLLRTVDLPPRPRSYYSVSKVFGESLGYLYASKFNVQFVAVRIGNFNIERPDPEHPHHLGHADAVRLFERAAIHPGVQFVIVFGVSDSTWLLYDLDHGRKVLDYRPEQKAIIDPPQ